MAPHPHVPPELTSGPFTLVEAQSAGLTWKQVQGTSWRRLGGGLYVWRGLGESPALMLAAIRRRLPPGAAFSGRTAAWVHGLDLPPCDPVEATVPSPCGTSGRAGVSIRRAPLATGDVVERRGLPVTTPLRTAVDLACNLPTVEAVVAVDMALHRRLLDLEELSAWVDVHPRSKGIARLRRVAELAEPGAESPMETRLRLLLVLAGLPPPRAQVSVLDGRGRFLGRSDLYYPNQRLCIEYDGGTHRDSLVEDNRRQNRLLSAGYRLLRFTAADIHRSPETVVALVRSALSIPSKGSWGDSPAHLPIATVGRARTALTPGPSPTGSAGGARGPRSGP